MDGSVGTAPFQKEQPTRRDPTPREKGGKKPVTGVYLRPGVGDHTYLYLRADTLSCRAWLPVSQKDAILAKTPYCRSTRWLMCPPTQSNKKLKIYGNFYSQIYMNFYSKLFAVSLIRLNDSFAKWTFRVNFWTTVSQNEHLVWTFDQQFRKMKV